MSPSFRVGERNFSRTADTFRKRRREGPHRFTKKQRRTFVSALASFAAAETSKISAFARFSESFDSRLLQQYRHQTDVAVATVDVCFVGKSVGICGPDIGA